MNNDIKEKIKAYYIGKDIDEILDCITNLQEDIRTGKEIINELTKENEKLRMRNDMLRKDIDSFREDLDKANDIIEKDRQFNENRLKEWLDYKQRIDKAIEYIKHRKENCERQEDVIGMNILISIEEILQGSDEE